LTLRRPVLLKIVCVARSHKPPYAVATLLVLPVMCQPSEYWRPSTSVLLLKSLTSKIWGTLKWCRYVL